MASNCFGSILNIFGLKGGHARSQTADSAETLVPGASESETYEKSTEPVITSPSGLRKDSRILIVGGGGTIGSSTALFLARRGYINVHILDVFPIPSGNSAGNDLNKIIGFSTDHRGFRKELSDAYINGWKHDPVFAPYYHPTGMLQAAHSTPEKIAHMRAVYDRAVEEGWAEHEQLEWLDNEEDILRRAPHLAEGDIKGWKGLWSGNAGWAAARDAIESVGHELKRLGVEMTFGSSGTFKEPLLSADGKKCVGVVAVDGTKWEADRVVLATGAWSPALVDLQGQCTSKCWIIGHLQLTAEEAAPLKGIPVVYHDEIGFFFEPCPKSNIIKVCNEFPGYTRYMTTTPFGSSTPQHISVPRSHAVHPSDTMPSEGADDVKRVIDILLPRHKDRKLVDQKMCWCTDTDDAQWLFCEDPRWKGLFLATGDSGHTFHTLPYVGHEVADMLEGKLSKEKQEAWGWRPGHGDPHGSGRGGPAPKDISDLPGWAHGDPIDEE